LEHRRPGTGPAVSIGLGGGRAWSIVVESILAFTVIKFVGVAYLLYLALRQWRASGRDFGEKVSATPSRAGFPLLARGFRLARVRLLGLRCRRGGVR
jgi:threonine/homoserine/homoserine lactone efflux protein